VGKSRGRAAARDAALFKGEFSEADLVGKTVVAVDPGSRRLFTAIRLDDTVPRNDADLASPGRNEVQQEHGPGPPTTTRDTVRFCREGEWRELSGARVRQRRRAYALQRHADVQAFERTLPSRRVSSSVLVLEVLGKCAREGGPTWKFECSISARRTRFEAYRQSERTLDLMCARILGVADGGRDPNEGQRGRGVKGPKWRPDVVVVYGSAKFTCKGPTFKLKRRMTRFARVPDQDEWGTSKLCSECWGELDTDGGRLDWGVRRCSNRHDRTAPEQSTFCLSGKSRPMFWDRDVGAARNIGMKFLARVRKQDLPGVWKNNAQVQPFAHQVGAVS
jgi:hypothetical protein